MSQNKTTNKIFYTDANPLEKLWQNFQVHTTVTVEKKRHLRLNSRGHSQPHIYNKCNRPDGEKIHMCNNNETNL